MKNGLIAVAIIVALGAGFFVLQSGGSDNDAAGSDTFVSAGAQNNNTPEAEKQEAVDKPEVQEDIDAIDIASQQPAESSGATDGSNYILYKADANAINDSADTKRIVFFHASWCPTCNAFEDDILQKGVPSGVTLIQADFDDDTELKQRYGVNVQSTFVLLDANGEVQQSWPFGRGLSGIQDLYDQVDSI